MNPELNQAIDFDRVLEQIGNYASFSCSIETGFSKIVLE